MARKKTIKIPPKYNKVQRFALRVLFVTAFIAIVIGVIAYARGYRFNLRDKIVSSTGILAISSSPKAARVYVNENLKGVTDLNLTLPPGTYTVEIQKDGFTSYKKTLVLKGELVETIDPILFPVNPSLNPLTNLGVIKAVQVDQSNNVIVLSQSAQEKDGIYIFDSGSRAINLFPTLKTLALKTGFPFELDFSTAEVIFSDDYEEAIFDFPLEDGTTASFLLSLNAENQSPLDVTLSKEALVTAWEQARHEETSKLIEALPKEIRKVASDSFSVISFSSDQTKLLYRASKDISLPLVIDPPLIASNQTKEERSLAKDSVYVYDKKEDKNFQVGDSKLLDVNVLWYSDSKRLVLRKDKRIAISHYDGENEQIVYSGPLESDFFAVNSNGRLVILANLNPQSNKFPDLYLVGIR